MKRSKSNVKWGHLHQVDMRTKVGSPAWKKKHSRNIQHLSAYRRLHDIAEHSEIRNLVNASVSEKLKAIERIENSLKE